MVHLIARQGDLDGARAAFLKAITKDPKNRGRSKKNKRKLLPTDSKSGDDSVQLRAAIIQTEATAIVAAMMALEGVAAPSPPQSTVCAGQCGEWVARVFLDEGQSPATGFGGLDCLQAGLDLSCRTHRGSAHAMGCTQKGSAAGMALRRVCAMMLQSTFAPLEARVDRLLAAVAAARPGLAGRLKFGADVTIRRTCTARGGHDVEATGYSMSGVHCDSWDGTILCFGLCSTKLGTPVYPEAVFPSPVDMFLTQSRTGKSLPYTLGTVDQAHLGPLRRWKPGTLVVLPAATAHSKPAAAVEVDEAPETPRWFCRVTIRLAIAGRRPRAQTNELTERLALALLVAEHVWGDTGFAAAAQTRALAKAAASIPPLPKTEIIPDVEPHSTEQRE